MNEQNTKTFAFVLGRESELALSELKAVLARFGFCFSASDSPDARLVDIFSITDNIAFAKIDNFSKEEAEDIINILGGTTKIYEIIESRSNKLENQIVNIISEHRATESKLNFGISWFAKNKAVDTFRFGLGIKKTLKNKGLSVRYVESKESELSTILSKKNDLAGKGIEIGVFNSTVGILLAVTNPYEWSKRDYEKPAADKYSGMVPPKLARMMVNLALDQIQDSGLRNRDLVAITETQDLKPKTCLVMDPFCGSGNIILEAMLLGYDVFGSDISSRAVRDTQANIDWLLTEYGIQKSAFCIKEADAVTVDFKKMLNANDCITNNYSNYIIVTEPFLGEPKKFTPSLNAARGEYRKIRDMYIQFLDNVAKLQNSDSKIVFCIVFPLVETTEGDSYSLYEESVDEIRKLGYTLIRKFNYGREYQVVKREIVLLTHN